MLDGLPLSTPGVAADLPSIVVSTPEDAPAEGPGYVDGPSEIEVVLTVAVYAVDEDAVDELLGHVEQRIREDDTLRGTAGRLEYQGFSLEADESAYVGAASWTATVFTGEV